MNLNISQWKLREEFDRVRILHFAHFIFIFLSFINQCFVDGAWGTLFFGGGIGLGFYHLYYQMVKKLYYTYWSFSLFLLLFIVLTILFGDLSSSAFYLRLLGFTFLVAQMWTLYTPIYYPIVSWWEYDFRYRDDVKVKVMMGENVTEGRLTDLRRKSACLQLFEELNTDDEVDVKPQEGYSLRSFKVQVMSKRRPTLGRPYNYGVRFLLQSDEEKKDFQSFYHFWRNERKHKMRMKFQNQV